MTFHEQRAEQLEHAIAIAARMRGYPLRPVLIDPRDVPLDKERAITFAISTFYRVYGGEK